jgi:hypothetical protein
MPRISGKLPGVLEVYSQDGKGALMTRIKMWSGIFACFAVWIGLYGFYLRLEKTLEPKLFSAGQPGKWWTIVLLYWIIDTCLFLCLAWFAKRPFGFRLPPNFPFFQYGTDVFVLMLLVHLAWLCTDNHIYSGLDSAGLTPLPWVFTYLAFGWAFVAVMKYRQLANIFRRIPQ